MIVLAIETSCDETACAIVKDGRDVLSNIISSQAELFEKYGGVVPEIASRKHMEYMIPVVSEAMQTAGIGFGDVDAVAVTKGPGLVGALLAGISLAKGIAMAMEKPLIGVNHLEGHIAANYIGWPELEPPFLCLLVSGGHSHILRVDDYTDIKVLGRTRDDAAGEAFDKIARAIGLGYPGGPKVDAHAAMGNRSAYDLPRTKFKDNPYDFSFSGLKTAVLNIANNSMQKDGAINVDDICASFQYTVARVLVENTMEAADETGVRTIVVAGGVAANSGLRREMAAECFAHGYKLHFPPLELCTDNAAMIGSAAYFHLIKGESDDYSLNAVPSLKLGV
ncbi:MAG: tRNA (adenosine(37)-N6)-threonylcarbamoyltransferase complex transferase subunit TsaD [Clostridia bacterium]|nr:tRNA (adenosine(37)-N6)-threonylcarbamoyltransferase complex transferase subunit TsaD [Clostridia bacterium]